MEFPYPTIDRRSVERRHLLPDAVQACAAQIAAHLRGAADETAMSAAIAAYARHVHALGIPPERALARLKEAILRIPEVASRPAMERAELLRASVQVAIGAYYSLGEPDL